MNDKEFETMLLQEVTEFGGTVKERKPTKLYAREWQIRLPQNRMTISIHWDAEEEEPKAMYATKDSKLSKTVVHRAMVDTPERLRAYLRKQSETP